jgi:hypothetical protein
MKDDLFIASLYVDHPCIDDFHSVLKHESLELVVGVAGGISFEVLSSGFVVVMGEAARRD